MRQSPAVNCFYVFFPSALEILRMLDLRATLKGKRKKGGGTTGANGAGAGAVVVADSEPVTITITLNGAGKRGVDLRQTLSKSGAGAGTGAAAGEQREQREGGASKEPISSQEREQLTDYRRKLLQGATGGDAKRQRDAGDAAVAADAHAGASASAKRARRENYESGFAAGQYTVASDRFPVASQLTRREVPKTSLGQGARPDDPGAAGGVREGTLPRGHDDLSTCADAGTQNDRVPRRSGSRSPLPRAYDAQRDSGRDSSRGREERGRDGRMSPRRPMPHPGQRERSRGREDGGRDGRMSPAHSPRGQMRPDVRLSPVRHVSEGSSHEGEVDVAARLQRLEDAAGILALLKVQQHRITLAHISQALDKLLDQTADRDATAADEAVDLLCEMALARKAEVQVSFCRRHARGLKTLKRQAKATTALAQMVCDILCSSLPAGNAADFAESLPSLVELPVAPPDGFWAEVGARGRGLVHEFSLAQAAAVLWAIAKMRAGDSCGDLVDDLSGRLPELLEHNSRDVEPEIVSNIIGGYATLVGHSTAMRERLPARVVDVLVSERSLRKLSGWKPAHAATCLWGVAILGLAVEHASLDLLAQHAGDSLRACPIEPLSNLFWAFASLAGQSEWMPQVRLLTKMCERGLSLGVHQLSELQVSSLLWSIASLDTQRSGALANRHAQVVEFVVHLVGVLPQLVRHADAQFVVQTLHAMASMQMFHEGLVEDDTTCVRRSRVDNAPDMLRDKTALAKAKCAVVSSYRARGLEVASQVNGAQATSLLWAIRTLTMDAGADLLAMLSRHDDVEVDMAHAVDVLWTHAVLWQKPQPDVMDRMREIAETGRGFDEMGSNLVSVTRFLWALAVLFVLGAGDDKWRSVLDKTAGILLQHADSLTAVSYKQLHQFFLTCNTCVALVDVLPDAMFSVKDQLENQCCVHVREASAAARLEHRLGNSCAAQLAKMGLETDLEVACPNTGYNLDLVVSAGSDAAQHLQPLASRLDAGHRGWVLEIDRSCHYLTGSGTRKEGRCMLREAHLEAVGYSIIRISHAEWEEVLLRPDRELQRFLSDRIVECMEKTA